MKMGTEKEDTYANSLSILSPNPGVSTMVRAIRTPSSSSSADFGLTEKRLRKGLRDLLTNVDWLNSNPLFNMRSLRIVGNLMS